MENTNQSAKRKRLLTMLTAVFLGAGLAYGAYWGLHGRFHETTDDASVAGNLLRISPRVAGTVVSIGADDTDFVKQGQVLVKLDDSDAKVALAKAESDLAETVRHVQALFDTAGQFRAELALKQENLRLAQADLARRDGAAADHSISREEMEHAQSAVRRAQAELALTAAQADGAAAQVARTTEADHPAVRQAAARVREAFLALQRCEIRAPQNGYIAKRAVQVGQPVAVGMPLMTLVPLHELWAEANFKEDQLERLRLGQPVTLSSDLYGSGVAFHGEVLGLAPGTGGVFSLLPPQNASGNWIKIVQRLPVRIGLDPKELAAHPLRVGVSLKADVDTHDTRGPALAGQTPSRPRYSTPIYDNEAVAAEQRIRAIIAANRR